MKSLLEEVTELDSLIHSLEKMESQMKSGRWIDSYRGLCRLMSALQKAKSDVIANNQKKR
jgi:hypothetical protein